MFESARDPSGQTYHRLKRKENQSPFHKRGGRINNKFNDDDHV
jgi:hypothetical protein